MALNIDGTTGISGVDASVSAPALTGTDSNTGISFPSADTIKFSTGGVERMSITNSGVSGITAGITMLDQYRLTTSFTGPSEPISSNIERVDTHSPAFIGSAMSVSSGIFTFPSTGMYEVSFYLEGQITGDSRFHLGKIFATTDGTNFTEAARGANSYYNGGGNVFSSCVSTIYFDVTDTSTHKVKFHVNVNSSSTQTNGVTDKNTTYFTFKRIGDT
tara:strand:- start:258 stop:908 length:651 start_codon:yes stop_codon:yes gene_type:complete